MCNDPKQKPKTMKSLLPIRSEKPVVNFLSRIAVIAALMLIASAPAALAQIYTFSFTGNSGIDATGTITVSGGVATSGSINVVNVPLESLPGTTTASGNLLSLSDGSPISGSQSNVRDQGGDVITYDVAAFAPPSDPILMVPEWLLPPAMPVYKAAPLHMIHLLIFGVMAQVHTVCSLEKRTRIT